MSDLAIYCPIEGLAGYPNCRAAERSAIDWCANNPRPADVPPTVKEVLLIEAGVFVNVKGVFEAFTDTQDYRPQITGSDDCRVDRGGVSRALAPSQCRW